MRCRNSFGIKNYTKTNFDKKYFNVKDILVWFTYDLIKGMIKN